MFVEKNFKNNENERNEFYNKIEEKIDGLDQKHLKYLKFSLGINITLTIAIITYILITLN